VKKLQELAVALTLVVISSSGRMFVNINHI